MSVPRTSVQIPKVISERLRDVAKEYDCTVSDILRKCIQLGLLGIEIDKDESRKLIIRSESDGEIVDETIRLLF